jgi:hypothetical protein
MHKSLITVPKSEDSFKKAKRTNRKKDVLIVNRGNQGRVTTFTPRKKKHPESITYKRKGILYYKAHPKARPEIQAIDGLPIWFYNKFVADVEVEGKQYRVFYNPISKELLANEISYENYDGEECMLLRNPANLKVSKRLMEVLIEENIPEKDWLDTLANHKQRVEKYLRKQKLKLQSKKNGVGSPPKIYLIKAILWYIENQPKKPEDRRPTLLRAYEKFKKAAIKEESAIMPDSFVKMVTRRYNELRRKYYAKSREYRSQNSLLFYAKSELKIPPNKTKQKVKENEKGLY